MQDRDRYEHTMALGAYVFGALAIGGLMATGLAFGNKLMVLGALLSAGLSWMAQFAANWAHLPSIRNAQHALIAVAVIVWMLAAGSL